MSDITIAIVIVLIAEIAFMALVGIITCDERTVKPAKKVSKILFTIHFPKRQRVIQVRVTAVDGRKQYPKDNDFHITPSLVFAHNDKFTDLGKVYGIGLVWGYWGVIVGFYIVYLNK